MTDVALASTFSDEAKKLKQSLDPLLFDHVISSPLGRCTQLAAILATGHIIAVDVRLSELNFGDWEMMDWDSIYESPEGQAWFADHINTKCLNGEAFTDQIARTRSFLAEIRAVDHSRILLVTHAGSIRAMMCLLQGKTPEEVFNTPLDYGQIITFNLEKK